MTIRGATRQKDIMASRGYLSAADAARLTGNHVSTIHRWMDEGQVAGEIVGGTRRYVEKASLRAHLGDAAIRLLAPEAAAALGVPAVGSAAGG